MEGWWKVDGRLMEGACLVGLIGGIAARDELREQPKFAARIARTCKRTQTSNQRP